MVIIRYGTIEKENVIFYYYLAHINNYIYIEKIYKYIINKNK